MIFIVEAFFSGCISKVINDGKDYSWFKIKSVVKDRHDQNISTKICRVIEKALNIVTEKKYKDSDDIYDAIEQIFNEFKNHSDSLQSVKCGLSVLGTDISDQRCENFLEIFYEGICRDDDLYKVVMLDLEQKGIKISQEEFRKLNEKIDRNHKELVEKLDSLSESGNEEKIDAKKLKFQNNKKQDYIKIWNSKLFLHFDNDERPITLADAFILSDFEMYKKNDRIGFHDDDSLEHIINKFVKYDRTSTMLITGVPGIGKSSITAWIANKYKEDDRVVILRFRDWDYNDFRNGLLNAICDILCCNRKDLSDKILVLDGFDEIKCLDSRNRILNGFINDINDLERSKIIITSRPAYIDHVHFNNNIFLCPFNIEKIKKFYEIITGKVLNERDIDINNLDVLGVPVILYMAIMSGIDITKSATKPELYNCIFAERGGIFDKFCEYDSGSQIMRNPENIVCYLEFLRTVAFKMFKGNGLVLSRNECEIPELSFQGKNVSVLEFPIKHLFESTWTNIEFIHKSIYEYFMSEYIYNLIDNILLKEEKTLEIDLAGVLGGVFSSRKLSDEILEFLKYKIRSGKLRDKFDIINETFQLMLENGMTYYTKMYFKNVIECEMNVFANMLEVIHLWEENFLVFNYSFVNYLKLTRNYRLNLRGATVGSTKENSNNQIKMINGQYLRDIVLTKADLRGADLKGADLRGADLIEANLIGADLIGADLIGADLIGAIFDEEQIEYLSGKFNLQGTKVYVEKKDEIMSYEDYCKINPNQISIFDYFKDIGEYNPN